MKDANMHRHFYIQLVFHISLEFADCITNAFINCHELMDNWII